MPARRPEAFLVRLTPALASELRATSSQSVRDKKVQRFIDKFSQGWYPDIHRKDPIILRDGKLENGNHRCEAIARWGEVSVYIRHYPSRKDDQGLIRRIYGASSIGQEILGLDEGS